MSGRRLELAGDAGWASLGCALPLFLLGAAVWVFPPRGVWGTTWLSLLFVGFGLWGGLWRQRLILDGDAGVVTFWQGLLRPMSVRRWPLTDFQHVAIHCWRKGIPTTLDQVSSLLPYNFPIQLEGTEDTVRLEFAADYAAGRARAERVARLLGLPLLDDCAGTALLIPAQPVEIPEIRSDDEPEPAAPARLPWRPVMPRWKK